MNPQHLFSFECGHFADRRIKFCRTTNKYAGSFCEFALQKKLQYALDMQCPDDVISIYCSFVNHIHSFRENRSLWMLLVFVLIFTLEHCSPLFGCLFSYGLYIYGYKFSFIFRCSHCRVCFFFLFVIYLQWFKPASKLVKPIKKINLNFEFDMRADPAHHSLMVMRSPSAQIYDDGLQAVYFVIAFFRPKDI